MSARTIEFTPEMLAEAVLLHREGVSMPGIARAIGASYYATRKGLRDSGVLMRPRGWLSEPGRKAISELGKSRKGRVFSAETRVRMSEAAKRRVKGSWTFAPLAHNLTGEVFGRLTVVARDFTRKYYKPRWLCQCDCGEQKVVRAVALKSGTTRSCGCLAREGTKKRATRHGKTGSPTYLSWRSMIVRCERDPRATRYFNRVTVCEEWHRFDVFLRDMGERPAGTTLDRVDNARGYEPGNCRWATCVQQTANRTLPSSEVLSAMAKERNVRGERHGDAVFTEETAVEAIQYRAIGFSLSEIADRYGVTKSAVWALVKRRTWSHLKIHPALEAFVLGRSNASSAVLDQVPEQSG